MSSWFQDQNPVIHHLHMTPSAHPNKCSLRPITHLAHSPPISLQQPSVCSLYLRESYGFSLSVFILFSLPFAYVHPLCFNNSQLWKELKCPLTDEWIKKMLYTHTHTHQNTTQQSKRMKSCHFNNVDRTRVYYAKRSKSEKDKYHMTSLICRI